MKLSQMNTEQLADALCMMADPIDKIGMDEAFTEKLKEVAERGKLNKIQNVTTMFATFVPLLLKNKREETFQILSALTGKTVEEIAKQKGMVTLKDAMESIDEDFINFFRQSADTAGVQSSQQQQKA